MRKYVNKTEPRTKMRTEFNKFNKQNKKEKFSILEKIKLLTKRVHNIEYKPLILIIIYIYLLPKFITNIHFTILYVFLYFSSGFLIGIFFKKDKNFFREIVILLLLTFDIKLMFHSLSKGDLFPIFLIIMVIALLNIGIYLGVLVKKIIVNINGRYRK